jgi:hypothetical protein
MTPGPHFGLPPTADGPHPAYADALALYGQFIGEWDVQVTNYPEDEPPIQRSGEWIFGWALEGRAVQDVWIVPPRAERDPADPAAGPFGSTIRFYVPSADVWRIVWVNPSSDTVATMTARRVGDEIVQDGTDDEGRSFRWVFSDIEPARFRWRSEQQREDGSWRLLQEMAVERRR